eukprot:1375565-Alexandrium_andersonii.AAC.1
MRNTLSPRGAAAEAPVEPPAVAPRETPAVVKPTDRMVPAGSQALVVDPVAIAVPIDDALDGEAEATHLSAPPA